MLSVFAQSMPIKATEGNNLIQLDISSLSSGMYFLKLTGKSMLKPLRFVKD